jgi:adenosine deaminase
LKVVERFLHGKDPVLLLHEAGLCISVNSDDPAYFGDYVAGTMIGSLRAKPLQEEEIRALAVTLARNSFMSAFMPEHKRALYLAQLEAYLAA